MTIATGTPVVSFWSRLWAFIKRFWLWLVAVVIGIWFIIRILVPLAAFLSSPQSMPIQEPVQGQSVVVSEGQPTVIQTCKLTTGEVYSFVSDQNGEIWQQNSFLADAKRDGATCALDVPTGYYAVVNQSAGSITVNGAKADLGNPAEISGNTHFEGQIISDWSANNDSAGTMIRIFRK